MFSDLDIDIVVQLARGDSYKAVAAAVRRSPATVAYHTGQLQRRLKVRSVTAVVAFAIASGVIGGDTWPLVPTGVHEVDLDAYSILDQCDRE
ncbi:LuxR C-terminal-related transcriptional regulator [Galbitalea sp. SE-J8]|uniref:LuxR C-terminal-related transcriptional regulator n=1 Tax=Galbitalea sp. SE-J8 TaxID=3054952 RepID=UPI00259C87B9|nr:LuxR C-terminal-related transcriptional regulator [Galbitalea sp. SE-J8]MDM4763054.1 LuxR C-terminal-related transcriptional regulator [Galbitalea sp. SE-J8]